MNLYEKIVNPFMNDDVLKKIIQIYSEKNDQKSIYTKVVNDENNKNFNREKYIQQYESLIVKPTLHELFENAKNRVTDSKNLLAIDKGKFQIVAENCKTFEELEKKINGFVKSEDERKRLSKLPYPVLNGTKEFFVADLQYYYDEILTFLTEDEIQEIAPYVITEVKLKSLIRDSEEIMGFHVNPEKVMNPEFKNLKDEIKFYINAGDDTCKVASLFRDKCRNNKLNYYFKVANPYKNEEGRSDKLCIYSTREDVKKYYDILNEIKNENPDILFGEPPLLSGKIDGWIGIASDFEEKNNRSSYNDKTSSICEDVIENICQNIPKENLCDYINTNSEMLNKIRIEILNKMEKIGYSKEKACINKKCERALKRNGRMSIIDRLKIIFSKTKALPEPIIEKVSEKKRDFKESLKVNSNIDNENMYNKKEHREIPLVQQVYPVDEGKDFDD